MTLPTLPAHALTELGRTEGSPATLAHLTRDQDTRRLLMLRAILDATDDRRLREDWALLEEAEAIGTAAPVRARLLHPPLGPWAARVLRNLDAYDHELAPDRAYFSAVAASAASRSGLPFSTRLTPHDGRLVLPSLGVLRTRSTRVDITHRQGRLTLKQPGAADIRVHLEDDYGAWSGSRAWTSAYALPGLLPQGSAPMPLDDLDPYRTEHGGPHYYGLSGPVTLDDAERKRWLHAWSGTATALRLGGEQRLAEATALLRCLVPLAVPQGTAAEGRTQGTCSATRREAFGAVLSSTPPTATGFAATLVHELQHAKLIVLSEMVTLHQADGAARYFAPWRPDPRPYDGLLQGAYSHLALADYFQRLALGERDPVRRESAWALFARYHEQVGATLPALVGSGDLTAQGRQFIDSLVGAHERMTEHPAPRAHAVRAREYVRAARRLWAQRHTPDVRHSRD